MILERILWLAGTIILMGLAAFVFFRLFRVLIAYKITDKNITVLLFHFLPIYRVRFEKIVKMHSARVHEVAVIPGWHFPSRVFGRRVVIEMKDTWFRYAFLTPENPDAFISEIKKHLANFSENSGIHTGGDFGFGAGARPQGARPNALSSR